MTNLRVQEKSAQMSHTPGRTGTQAQLSGRTWIHNKAKAKAPRKKRGRKTTLLHPRFLECSKYITDPQWRLIFEDAAYGKFLPRFGINNERLIYKKPKIISLDLPSDTEKMIKEVMDFMRRYGNVCTEMEKRERQKQLQEQQQKQNRELVWSKIDSHMKEILLIDYAQQMKKEHQLNPDEYRNCILTLRYAIQVGFLGSEQITLEKRRITHIKGISLNPETRQTEIDLIYQTLPRTKSSKSRKTGTPENLFAKAYNKEIDKILARRQGREQIETELDNSDSELSATYTHSLSVNNVRFSRRLNQAAAS
jgi:hypothetical protein